MFEEAISLFSLCSSMNSWLTPTVLFLLLNLMIGTIAFTSHHHHNNLHDLQQQRHHHQQQQPIFQQHQQQPPFFQQHQQQQLQPQLSRSNSVLQRLKSINFNSLYTFYTNPPTTHYQQPTPPPSQPESRPEPTLVRSEVEGDGYDDEDEGEGPTLDEIYSRIKQGNQVSHYGRQNSDTKPSGGEIPVKLPQKMKKSASTKSAFGHFHFQRQTNPDDSKKNGNVGVAVKKATLFDDQKESAAAASIKEEREDEGVESVDTKADDFINRFKKQLQLQRNDSILRYKDMISRISAK